LIAHGIHIVIFEGNFLDCGQSAVEVLADLHETLKLFGTALVQKYRISEVKKVYPMQWMNVNDQHIERIAGRMLCQVTVTDSDFVWGQ
jgi:hypothetical protein